jgi:hypothetical protein
MELTELFDLDATFEAARGSDAAGRLAQAFRDRAAGGDATLEAHIAAVDGLVDRAAAWTALTLGDGCGQPGSSAVHHVAALALVVDRHDHTLIDPATSASNAMHDDLEALVPLARGESVEVVGPLSRYVADVVSELSGCPGYARGQGAFGSLFAALVEGIAQEIRIEGMAHDEALRPVLSASAQGGWVDLVVEAACIVMDDHSRATKDPEASVIARIAASAVAVARDLGEALAGGDSQRAKEMLCQRFAVTPHVIQLDDEGIRRALSATVELEVRDLIDALGYLPSDQPRAAIVRRAVAGIIELDGSAHVVVGAVSGQRSEQADLMEEMGVVARSDGRITSDERAMLRGMDTQLLEFQRLMVRVCEDRQIDEEEFEQIRSTRQKILDELFRIALADDQITGDERDLLLRAMELVPALR